MKKLLPILIAIIAFSCTKDELSKPNIQTFAGIDTAKVFYIDKNIVISKAIADNGTRNGKPVILVSYSVVGNLNVSLVELMAKDVVIDANKVVYNGSNELIDISNFRKPYALKLTYKDGTKAQTKEF